MIYLWLNFFTISQRQNDFLWPTMGISCSFLSCLLGPFSVHILTYISHNIVIVYSPSFNISFFHPVVHTPALPFSSITPSFSCCLYYVIFSLPLFHHISLLSLKPGLISCKLVIFQSFSFSELDCSSPQ